MIDEALQALVRREGGYVDNPKDRGGPTKYGITEQRARANGFEGRMRDLPLELALSIYRKQYWSEPRFYEVSLRYPALAEKLFDCGVNMGPQTASKFLQASLNVLNREASDYPDIPVDGQIGALSLHSLDLYKQRRGAAGELVLLRALNSLQGSRYIGIAQSDKSQEAFMYGWLANRIGDETCA